MLLNKFQNVLGVFHLDRSVKARPSRCSDDRNAIETLPGQSQASRTIETPSIASIELSSIRTIRTIV